MSDRKSDRDEFRDEHELTPREKIDPSDLEIWRRQKKSRALANNKKP